LDTTTMQKVAWPATTPPARKQGVLTQRGRC
jgi:hypothetical protein